MALIRRPTCTTCWRESPLTRSIVSTSCCPGIGVRAADDAHAPKRGALRRKPSLDQTSELINLPINEQTSRARDPNSRRGSPALTAALADFSDALVSREWRNIDLLIESKNNKLVFVIENKIDASESEHQLSKYEEIVRSKFSDQCRVFAYLTKDGEPPSDQLWSAISYSDVIDALQEAREHLSSLNNETAMVIDNYISLIRRNIVPDQELIDQCRKLYAKHKAALDLILRYGEVNTFETAASQFFEAHTELKSLGGIRAGAAAFLPMSLCDVTPQMEGTTWWGQSRPILYWFNLRPDRL